MNDFKKLRSDLQKIAKKENIDISKVRLWNNEGSNILKLLTKINQSIPKWTWNKKKLQSNYIKSNTIQLNT